MRPRRRRRGTEVDVVGACSTPSLGLWAAGRRVRVDEAVVHIATPLGSCGFPLRRCETQQATGVSCR